MNDAINLNGKDYSKAGLFISVFFHTALFIGVIFLYKTSPAVSGGGGGYVEISAGDINSDVPAISEKSVKQKQPLSEELIEKVHSEKETMPKGSDIVNNNKSPAVNSSTNKTSGSGHGRYVGFSPGIGDTTALQQVYSEKSLNVTINYPNGWTFLDQNRRNKLDGVTFWANNGAFDPPPYIFLEVKEKYLFNPAHFKYNTKTMGSEIYYNDPVELEGQVSQIFYFRTNSKEDYSIKLIMNGREAFSAFQPVFFGMIKTFRFGQRLF